MSAGLLGSQLPDRSRRSMRTRGFPRRFGAPYARRRIHRNVVARTIAHVTPINSASAPQRYNIVAGDSAIARKPRTESRHFRRFPMSRFFVVALAVVVFAFGLAFPRPAAAASPPACTFDNLWTVEQIQTDLPDGFSIDYYLCMPSGWLLVGTFLCIDGNCSSD